MNFESGHFRNADSFGNFLEDFPTKPSQYSEKAETLHRIDLPYYFDTHHQKENESEVLPRYPEQNYDYAYREQPIKQSSIKNPSERQEYSEKLFTPKTGGRIYEHSQNVNLCFRGNYQLD